MATVVIKGVASGAARISRSLVASRAVSRESCVLVVFFRLRKRDETDAVCNAVEGEPAVIAGYCEEREKYREREREERDIARTLCVLGIAIASIRHHGGDAFVRATTRRHEIATGQVNEAANGDDGDNVLIPSVRAQSSV